MCIRDSCWAADTRLNHRSFTDAALTSGDRLSIGPIELEVVSVGQETEAKSPLDFPGKANSRVEAEPIEPREDRRWLDAFAVSLQQREASLAVQVEQCN